jgi:predicted nucleotide-binding protein (sugar kinase/HSP70/actin superfamily)
MRIGIPRALSYYRDFPPWRAFLEMLDAEVVVSPPTTRATLEAGISYTVPEACLPLKVFCGHVRALIGQCDALLVPSIHRYAPGSTNCAQLIGLPDMLRATMGDLPPLIAPDVDLSEGARSFWALALQVGRTITLNPLLIRDAGLAALRAYNRMSAQLQSGQITPSGFVPSQPHPRARGAIPPPPPDALSDGLTVAAVGHPYNLHDPFVNHNLLVRLARLGVIVLTPERLVGGPGDSYWVFEHELVGATGSAVTQAEVDGVLVVLAFGCGPDGVMVEQVQQTAASAQVPIATLTLDEHSGEAGLVTRLEAFVDMLARRNRRHGRIPGH